jgi:transcription elongation factor Elf1
VKIECPRCNQGWVSDARIKTSGEVIRVCDECEAAWPNGVSVAFDSFTDMSTSLKSKGLLGEWIELDAS